MDESVTVQEYEIAYLIDELQHHNEIDPDHLERLFREYVKTVQEDRRRTREMWISFRWLIDQLRRYTFVIQRPDGWWLAGVTGRDGKRLPAPLQTIIDSTIDSPEGVHPDPT